MRATALASISVAAVARRADLGAAGGSRRRSERLLQGLEGKPVSRGLRLLRIFRGFPEGGNETLSV